MYSGCFAIILVSIVLMIIPLTAVNQELSPTAPVNASSDTHYFITIDPIGDKYPGDKITIIALTNIPVGEEVIVDIGLPTPQLCPKAGCKEVYKESKILVKPGNNSLNKTIFDLETSDFAPNEYFLRERSLDQKTQSTVAFNLLARANLTQTTPLHTPKSPLSVIGMCIALIGTVFTFSFLKNSKKGDQLDANNN